MGQDKNGVELKAGDLVVMEATVQGYHPEGSVYVKTKEDGKIVNVLSHVLTKVETFAEEVKAEVKAEVTKILSAEEQFLKKAKEEGKKLAQKL